MRSVVFSVLLAVAASAAPTTDQAMDASSWSWRRGSSNAPTTTALYTTVCWTGAELLVWGAHNPSGGLYQRIAWRWNPATGLIKGLSLSNAPAVPNGQTAVWTGRHLCVWGGKASSDPTSAVNFGYRYDPIRDEWKPMSQTNAPTRRASHSAIWTGKEMIVCGGESVRRSGTGYAFEQPTDCGAYDPESDTWRALGTVNPPPGRLEPCLAWTGSELLFFGGWKMDSKNLEVWNVYYQDLWRYDMGSGRWSQSAAPNAPAGRQNNAAIWTGTEFIVWGGYNGRTYAQRHLLNDGARYRPGEDRWLLMNGEPPLMPSEAPAASWTGSDLVLWAGSSQTNSGALYHPESDSWIPLPTNGCPVGVRQRNAVWNGEEFIAIGDDVYCLGPDGYYRGDGLPDAWQLSHFGSADPSAHPRGDPDLDGCCNREEWLFGTDPTDSRSHPRASLRLTAEFMELRFPDASPYLTFDLARTSQVGSSFTSISIGPVRQNGGVVWGLPRATEPELWFRLGFREHVP
jgi:N-acetylneuraminic acid mutarotase